MCGLMAGRAAEIIYYGEEEGLSTGVGSDLQEATKRANLMVRHFSMVKDVGQIALEELATRGSAIPLTDQVARQVEGIVSHELKKAVTLIRDNKGIFDLLVPELLTSNRLSEEEMARILD